MRQVRLFFLMCCALALLANAGAAPKIYVGEKTHVVEDCMAVEFQGYVKGVTGRAWDIERVSEVPDDATGVVLGTVNTLPATGAAWPFGMDEPESDGYVLHALKKDNQLVVVAASNARGLRNGVYGLLERYGFGFYLDGVTWPDTLADLPELHVSHSPVFARRGAMIWPSFYNGAATWELADYKSYIDALVRMRCNLVMFRASDEVPFAAYEWDGELRGGTPLPNTSEEAWGNRALETDAFFAGTGQYFAREHFGPESSFIAERAAAIKAAKDVLAQAIAYAKGRDMHVCVGFEVEGNPLETDVQKCFEKQLTTVLEDYPGLDYLALWEREAEAINPRTLPEPRSLWESHVTKWSDAFGGLAPAKRQAEAARMALFGMHASAVLGAFRPDVQLVMSGWGGDNFLRFTDFLPGMDKVLPEDVVFAALDNMRVTPEVSGAYGEVAADRECWPILWLEFNGDLWMPQPNLAEVAGAVRDARDKGCQGLVGAHWRIEAASDSASYAAKLAWQPDLTVSEFCQRRAADLFGPAAGAIVAPYLVQLQELGYRWCGGWGQAEGVTLAWQPATEEQREQLAAVRLALREELIDSGYLGSGMVTDLALAGSRLFAMGLRNDRRAALDDLLAYIDYVLDLDRSLEALQPGMGIDELIIEERGEEAIARVQQTDLADALHSYASQLTGKSELGVLASINTKVWADLKDRLALENEMAAPLLETPEAYAGQRALHVLPDRVIATGFPEDDLDVELHVRSFDQRRFRDYDLEPLGNNTYALVFPEEVKGAHGVEYGIVAKYGFRQRLVWPADFPQHAVIATLHEPPPVTVPERPVPGEPQPVKLKHEVAVENASVRLMWEPRPGEAYLVSRDDKPLATVATGFFEDCAAPSGKSVTYAVTAQQLGTGKTAVHSRRIQLPEFPLPPAPSPIEATSRAGRVILGWECDSPLATQYMVSRLDAGGSVVKQMYTDAAPGYYVQATDMNPGTEPGGYKVSAIAPDGRVSDPSPQLGVIISDAPVEPLVQLSFDDESFLAGLAQLADNALALGGRGWAELPSQPEWNMERALTISVWVNLDDLDGMPVIVCKGRWQESGYFLQVYHKQVRFSLAGVDTLDAGAPKAGEWQMLTAVYGSGQMRIYVDGELMGWTRADGQPTPSTSPLLLGRYGEADDVYFVRGLMDEIFIYDVALTTAEIQDLYERTKRE